LLEFPWIQYPVSPSDIVVFIPKESTSCPDAQSEPYRFGLPLVLVPRFSNITGQVNNPQIYSQLPSFSLKNPHPYILSNPQRFFKKNLLVTIITSLEIVHNSLIAKYTNILNVTSFACHNLVIAKKVSVASVFPIVSPC